MSFSNAWACGAVPFESYTEKDSREAMKYAGRVVQAVKERLVEWHEAPEEQGSSLA